MLAMRERVRVCEYEIIKPLAPFESVNMRCGCECELEYEYECVVSVSLSVSVRAQMQV